MSRSAVGDWYKPKSFEEKQLEEEDRARPGYRAAEAWYQQNKENLLIAPLAAIQFQIAYSNESRTLTAPVEVGISSFNLCGGEINHFHHLVDVGNIPPDCSSNFQHNQNNIHGLVKQDFASGDSQYAEIWKDAYQSLDGSLVLTNDLDQCQRCMGWLSSRAKSLRKIQSICELSDLMKVISRDIFRNNQGWGPVFKDYREYFVLHTQEAENACYQHTKNEEFVYTCALSKARAIGPILKGLCRDLHIEEAMLAKEEAAQKAERKMPTLSPAQEPLAAQAEQPVILSASEQQPVVLRASPASEETPQPGAPAQPNPSQKMPETRGPQLKEQENPPTENAKPVAQPPASSSGKHPKINNRRPNGKPSSRQRYSDSYSSYTSSSEDDKRRRRAPPAKAPKKKRVVYISESDSHTSDSDSYSPPRRSAQQKSRKAPPPRSGRRRSYSSTSSSYEDHPPRRYARDPRDYGREPSYTRDSREPSHTRERDPRERRDPRDPRDGREPREHRDQRDGRERDPRDGREPSHAREHRDPRDGREPSYARDAREPSYARERDPRERRDPRDGREPSHARDAREHSYARERDPRDGREPSYPRDTSRRDGREPSHAREHRDPRDGRESSHARDAREPSHAREHRGDPRANPKRSTDESSSASKSTQM